MGRLVLVSNRVADMGQSAQAGGVAVALAENLRQQGGLWLGWDGTVSEEVGMDAQLVQFSDKVSIATTPITPSEHKQYYLGYSNSVLWPVLHNRLDLAQFEAGFYNVYLEVNRRFAKLLHSHLEPDDVIWVHDYHFISFAAELRRLGASNPIGFFLHIPFAPSQAFLALPEHRELAQAFSNYDFIGFQTTVDVAQFINSMRQGVGGQILQDGRVRILDRAVSVGSIPVSIDVREFAPAPAPASMAATASRPAGTLAKPARLIGIDRLDYTKGLPQKFRAFGRFLEKYPAYRNKVVLAQIAPPTRESLEAYSDIRVELETLSGSINGRFGDLDWVPIQYIHRARPRSSLRAVYRTSKVGLVTPLRDGMNLVAKEYVAAQDPNDPGVLILSQFAGAAEELASALIVNPYNIEEIADAIAKALNLSLDERKARHGDMLSRIMQHDTFAWCNDFLAALDNARTRDTSATPGHPGSLSGRLRELETVLNRSPAARQKDAVGSSPARIATASPTATRRVSRDEGRRPI